MWFHFRHRGNKKKMCKGVYSIVCVWYFPPPPAAAWRPGARRITAGASRSIHGLERSAAAPGASCPYKDPPRSASPSGAPVPQPNMDGGSGEFLPNTPTFLTAVRDAEKMPGGMDGVAYIRTPVVAVTGSWNRAAVRVSVLNPWNKQR